MLVGGAFRGTFFGLIGAAHLLAGCLEVDLGDSPFFCNNGNPRCPAGYVCVGEAPGWRCLREGTVPGSDSIAGREAGINTGVDQLMPWPDIPRSLDGSAPRPDTTPPDSRPVSQDGWPPHMGCQSHAECTDPANPCCCPILILPIWECQPVCLNPFCV